MKIKCLYLYCCLIGTLFPTLLSAQTIQCTTPRTNACGVVITADGGIIGPNEFCEGQTIRFRNGSTVSMGQIDSTLYCWDDGTRNIVAGIAESEHTFNLRDTCFSGGSLDHTVPFDIKMIVAKQCATGYSTHYITTPVSVRAQPRVRFLVPNPICAETDVTFTNTSCINDNSDQVSCLWNFGDGTTSTSCAPTVTHRYAEIRDYPVTLRIRNRCGERSFAQTARSTTKPAKADIRTTAGVLDTIAQPYVICLKDSGIVHLDGSFSPYATVFNWSVEPTTGVTMLTRRDSSRIRFRFTQGGNYEVTLTANNICQAAATKTVQFKVIPNVVLRLNPQNDTCHAFTYRPNPIVAGAIYTFDGAAFNPNTGVSVTAGAHTVHATYDAECGHQEQTMRFSLYPYVAAAMISPRTDTTVCLGGSSIPLIINQLGGGTWSSTPNSTLLVQNGNTLFNPQASGNFRLQYARGTGGCRVQTEVTIRVVAPPTVRLGADPPAICEGGAFQPTLLGYSDGNATTTVNWVLPMGSPATFTGENLPAIAWNTIGTSEIRVEATNICGTKRDTMMLSILPNTQVAVNQIVMGTCLPMTAEFNNTTQHATQYTWRILKGSATAVPNTDFSFEDSTSNTSKPLKINFLKGGDYTISLQAGGSCQTNNWTSSVIVVRAAPQIRLLTPADICTDVPFSLNSMVQTANYSTGNDNTATLVWHTPNASSTTATGLNPPEIRWNTAGTYSIKAVLTNNCKADSVTVPINILGRGVANVFVTGIPTNHCVPFDITINNQSANASSYNWVITNTIRNSPAIQNLDYQYINATNGASGSPQIRFLKGGTYKIGLGISNSCAGATWDTLFQIYSKPDITVNSIALTGICTPQIIDFQGVMSDSGGLQTRYRWRPTGDTNLIVRARRFDTSGTISFVLTATNRCGMDSDSTSVMIEPRPVVQIRRLPKDTVCSNAAPFTLTAIPANGNWSGTGVSTTGVFNPNLPNGTYPIVYQHGTGDCMERDTYRLTVFGTPVNAGAAVALCDTASPAFILLGATPLNGRWSGTGITDPILGQFSPLVSGSGVHRVTYTYIDTQTGCPSYAFKQVTIFSRPKAVMDSIPTACRDIEVQLTGINSLLSTSYEWQLGDGDTANVISPRHIYRTVATYTTRLIVTSQDGCKDTTTQTIRIAAPPTALPVPKDTSVCHQSTIPFRTMGIAENFIWTYPDGSATNLSTPPQTYVFNNFGLKDTTLFVRLAVRNAGCPTKTDTIPIAVQSQIKAVIAPDKSAICNNDSIRFANLSRGRVRSWHWDLGNGMISQDSIPFRNVGIRYQTIDTERVVQIRLIVEGDCGRDTAYYPIRILPVTTRAFFNMDKNTGCQPLTVRFENRSSSFAGIAYSFGDNTPNSSEPIVNHTFTEAGTYKIILYAFNHCGGFDTISQLVTVRAAPSIDSIGYKMKDNCSTTHVQFQAYTHGLEVTGHLWRFDNGDSSRAAEPNILFQNAGIHQAHLTLFSGVNNCPSIDSIPFILLPPVDLDVLSVLSDSCGSAGGVIVLNPQGGAVPYRFSMDDTLHWNTSPIFPKLQGRQYHIGYVRDARGCTDTVAVYVPGVAPLNVNAGGNQTLKLGDSTFVRATMNFNAVSVQWKAANLNWVRSPTTAGTWIFPLRTQVFGVFGQTANGCMASDSLKIQVIPVKFIDCPSAFSPNNDGENDYLRPQCSKDVIKIRVFRVYNRWGTLVYQRLNFDPQDINGGWDGTYGGVEQPIDVYTWYCEADFLDETSTATPIKGSTSLIR